MKGSEISGCYICKHADWGVEGCTCKLTKAIVRAPRLGCPKLYNQLDCLERAFKGFAKTQDELIEEYDATLKTHGDTLESHLETLQDHHERITINEGNIDSLSSDVEDLQRKVYAIYQFLNSVAPDFFFNLCEEIKKNSHKGSDFCGNCTHAYKRRAKDGIYACELSGEIVDPDDSSCSKFEPPF